MLRVTSEVGRLRRVLVHEPGAEIDHMVPAMMEELLFDDILFGGRAREEHGRFRRVLQILGVEVLEAEDLLARTLRDPAARAWTLDALLEGAPARLRASMADLPSEALAAALVGGVRSEGPRHGASPRDLFSVPPLPNWCFQRDPQIVMGSGVVFSSMATPARRREALLARAVFRFHPDLASAAALHEPLETGLSDGVLGEPALLEGGDVLVLSSEVIAVGHSERTNLAGIRDLAASLASGPDVPRWMLVVEIPKRRAYMHLDTLFTPIDRDAALVHAPVLLEPGPERAHVFEVDLRARRFRVSPRKDLFSALARRGVGLDPVPCGGADPVAQQREQWTDGANALAVAPGAIVMYDRNVGTIEELSGRGWTIVAAEDLLLGRDEVELDEGHRKVCVVLSSHELSRARGGPHCLTHPLERDDL